MEALPTNKTYKGFGYTQVCRGARSCVYRQTYNGKTEGFEVFIISIDSEGTFKGKFFEKREHWPKDEDFSKTAWTCWTMEEATEKFNQLEGVSNNVIQLSWC
jgi:hypothetical protein